MELLIWQFVGQYQGPSGTDALAIVAPIWNIIYSLGLFMGVGGSVIFSIILGKNNDHEKSNQYFTVSLLGPIFLSIIAWLSIIIFEKNILVFFGATEEEILSLSSTYLKPIKIIFPIYLFNQMISAFIRNDNDSFFATIAVLSGGIFNIFGDIFFTFVLDMGILGAGISTAIGSVITLIILLIHFLKKKNTLKIVKVDHVFKKFKEICKFGFSSFFVDAAMGILTIIFNRQILKYLGRDALAIYGPIINISTFVQCCAYSVGQASQPIISYNYGASKKDRINETLKYSLITVAIFSIFWTILSYAISNSLIRLFMKPTDSILKIAPNIIRAYSIPFLLPLNIFSTYYFQSINKASTAFVVSISRGLIISGALIMILPLIAKDAIWFAMPITELLVAIYVILKMCVYTKK